MTTLQTARKYEEPLTGEVEPAPYDYATMFKAEGFFARQQNKKRFTLLKGLDGKLRRMLRPGERVFFLTSGTTVTIVEHFFVGWMANYLNMRALVFTTERVLLVQIDAGKKKAKELVAQIPYTALASVKSTWTGNCRIKLMDRSEHNFVNVPKGDRKFLADFLADLVQGTAAPFGTNRPAGIENLCPHCFTHVPAHPPACPSCAGGFKSPKKAGLLSLAFPGLGDWYLGHRGFAVIKILSSGFLWLILIIAPLLTLAGPGKPALNAEYWVTAILLVLAAHLVDAVMTHYFARKGHHPGKLPSSLPPLVPARG